MTSLIGAVYDLLLCGGLLWVAAQAVWVRQPLVSVIVFMVFGLLMALVWARLGTPDLALAEAVIGAGVTGSLLLNACRELPDGAVGRNAGVPREAPCGLPQGVVIGICAAAGLGLAVLMAATLNGPGMTAQLAGAAAAAHVLENPVTVVLIDFRGLDTLLEMVVLLATCVAARIVMTWTPPATVPPSSIDDSPMVGALLGMATPVLVLTALYLFWAGSHAPGGAFQAGALLGALGVLYRLTGRLEPTEQTPPWLRVLLVVGLVTFSAQAVLTTAMSWAPMTLPRTGLRATVLIIEFTLMLSIAATLTFLFTGAPGFRPRIGEIR